ncbi:MAG: hypothetical protein NT062_19505 [Proteobacteria bacterium]|nr:hypothetical protein [Pseudomonadota bacterium]
MNRLIDYLREHLMIDFQGELTVEKVRELMADDPSREAKALLAKLVAEKKIEDMMLVLADCLLEPVQKSLTDDARPLDGPLREAASAVLAEAAFVGR